MCGSRSRLLLLLLGPLTVLIFGQSCSLWQGAATPAASEAGVEQTAETASYRIKLRSGPMVTMPTSMTMSAMATADQGQPVNRHLEVHIYDKGTGRELKEVVPTVTMTDQATGAPRRLPDVLACMISNHREIEPHFGDNLYLADGKYTVAVAVGDQIASFEPLVVKAAG